jgi:hypothetical protein
VISMATKAPAVPPAARPRLPTAVAAANRRTGFTDFEEFVTAPEW